MYRISVSNEEIEKLPLGVFPGRIVIIDKPGLKLNAAVAHLKTQKIIGFDTETKPIFNPTQPRHRVALLQLSTKSFAYLIRIDKLKGIPQGIIDVLSNPKILKIGAATSDDVRGLEKHHGFKPGGFFDLQKVAWEYGIRDRSVKKMAAIILDVKISKTQQLSNWEANIYTEAQKKYAATDAWICREMYLKLMESPKHPLSAEQMNQQQPLPPEKQASFQTPPMTPEEEAERKAAKAKKKREAEKARRKRVRARKAAEKAAAAAASTGSANAPAPELVEGHTAPELVEGTVNE